MNESRILKELEVVLEQNRQLNQQEIENVVILARGIENPDERDYYFCIISERLALTGGLNDLNKAVELALAARTPSDRHSALVTIAMRLMSARDSQRAFQVAQEAEAAAVQIEESNRHQSWEKAVAWKKLPPCTVPWRNMT